MLERRLSTRTEPRIPRPKQTRRPIVSVCIVNWNCRALLRDCLRSLTPKLQGVHLEVIVVDNGSTDGAPRMVRRLFPHVRLIRNPDNRGFAKANNQAARVARGRYLFFLNNDTVVPPGAVRRLVEYLRAHPDAGLVGPRLVGGGGRVQTSCRLRPTVGALLHKTALFRWTGLFRAAYRRYRHRDADHSATRPVEVLMGAALLMRRGVFRCHGPWDEDYTFGGEDIDLCTRIGRHHPVVYHPEVIVTHFGRAASRAHVGYSHTNTVVGITRYLRKSGTPRAALAFYKLALTIDAPLQWLCLAGQYVWRRVRGEAQKSQKCVVVLRGVGHFLRYGLWRLWRA